MYDKLTERQAFIEGAGEIEPVLEIGALNSPVYRRPARDAYVLDWLDQAALEKAYPKKENIVPVDFVAGGTDLESCVDRRFRSVIACHVIEHIPDLVTWFQQLDAITEDDGSLFLAVPDKRYTFDIGRADTKLSEILMAYHLKLDKPSVGQLFEHLHDHRKVDARRIWAGEAGDPPPPRMGVRGAWRQALEMAKTYHSCHCHVFESRTFADLVGPLQEIGLTRWRPARLQHPLPGSNEFLVHFTKDLETAPPDADA